VKWAAAALTLGRQCSRGRLGEGGRRGVVEHGVGVPAPFPLLCVLERLPRTAPRWSLSASVPACRWRRDVRCPFFFSPHASTPPSSILRRRNWRGENPKWVGGGRQLPGERPPFRAWSSPGRGQIGGHDAPIGGSARGGDVAGHHGLPLPPCASPAGAREENSTSELPPLGGLARLWRSACTPARPRPCHPARPRWSKRRDRLQR
jgi:hypothetical protein